MSNDSEIGPSFGQRHKGLIIGVVIFLIIFGSLLGAAVALLR